METIDNTAPKAISVIYYNVKRFLNKAKIEFDADELLTNITKRVFEKLSENPKAFQGHDIDSEAYITTEMFDKYGL